MKSYVLQKAKKLTLENNPPRSVKSGEIKVKIELAAITSTDLSIFNGKLKCDLPLILGRQAVGVVSEVSSENTMGLQKGNRVIIEGFLPCGKCYFCKTGQSGKCENMEVLGFTREGLFSDFAVVPASLAHVIPDHMSNATALYTEYVSMALNIIEKIKLRPGEHVAIMSANKLGYILAQLITYYQGIAIVIDNNQQQLDKLAEENINYTLNSKRNSWKENVSGITSGRMCEKVVYLTNAVLNFDDAVDICGINGTICIAGFLPATDTCSLGEVHNKQLTIVSEQTSQGNFSAAINMLATRTVNVTRLNGETFRFAELPEKMLAMTQEEAKYGGIHFKID